MEQINEGADKKGSYYQYGKSGRKYYFNSDKKSKADAKARATRQMTEARTEYDIIHGLNQCVGQLENGNYIYTK